MAEIRIDRRRTVLSRLSFLVVLSLPAALWSVTARGQAAAPASSASSAAPPAANPAPAAAPPAAAAPTSSSAPAPAPSSAPSAPPAPPTKEQLAEAKKFFDAGVKLSKEGLFQEALASFLEANRISPRESIQRNIAQTYRDLKDLASAYQATEALLALYGEKMKPNLKSNAQHALEELEVLTGVVAVNVQEPGVKVTIDGKDAGLTPLARPVRVNIGTHQVSLTKEGFEPIAQQAEIKGHDTAAVNGPMVKEVLTGHLSVIVNQTAPPDVTVRVFLDGKDVGPPPYQGDLEPGGHTIEAKGEVAASAPRMVEVAKKGTYTETIDLHLQQGTVAVNVDVADSEISLDTKVVAHGVYEGSAPIGAHTLSVTKPGYAPYKKDFLVHDGERIVENVALQRDQSIPVAPPHDWKGIYSHLLFVGQFEVTKPTNDVAQGIGYTADTKITGSGIAGGGVNVRVGYSFGFVGVEGSILLDYDHSSAQANVTTPSVTHPVGTGAAVPFTENYEFNRLGGNVSIGARLMPKTQIVRPTFGVAVGASIKGAFYKRSIPNTSPGSSGSSNYSTDPNVFVAPSLMLDGGIELGSTPGTRFYLGILMLAEFAGAVPGSPSSYSDPNYPAPTTPINVVNGTDVFLGPILGMQFGE